MAKECLLRRRFSYIPQLTGAIDRTGYIGILVWAERNRHHVTGVGIKLGRLLAHLQIPYAAKKENLPSFKERSKLSNHYLHLHITRSC